MSLLTAESNTAELLDPQDTCIQRLFETQVARTPDAVAAICEDHHLTYAGLGQRTTLLASYLRRLGAGPEVLVAVCMERSIDMLVALLGILKAGAAYLPLDPTYPPERLAFMLEDSRAPVLLTATTEGRGLKREDSGTNAPEMLSSILYPPSSSCAVVDLSADWPIIARQPRTCPDQRVRPDNLAYLIYTSGSTGRPKGVAITHQNAVSFLTWAHTVFAADQLRGVLASTSICFDLSIFELFAPLTSGGCVILAANLLQLPSLPARDLVTLLNGVPSAVAALLRLGDLPPAAQTVNLAGEALALALVQQLYRQPQVRQVYNLYGPSETTTYSTFTLVPRDLAGAVPIGRPIDNTEVYLLDRQGQPVPDGAIGELYIGGAGVARGYLNRPELTAERFVPNPFADHRPTTTDQRPPARETGRQGDRETGRQGNLQSLDSLETQHSTLNTQHSRLYKTGDLARYGADGNIEYLGRIDHQVKVRGFRIELGEIEAALMRQPAVREAVVIAREDVPGDQRLVAYIVPTNDQRPTTTDQRQGDAETRRHRESKTEQSAIYNLQSAIPETLSSILYPLSSIQKELRSYLREQLPVYMVPAAFVVLDALPRTPNGKLDRGALPVPDYRRSEHDSDFVAPRTAAETILADIWCEALRLAQVGVHDNFFDLGGHSLSGTQIVSRIRQAFRLNLTVRQLFACPTVAALAAYMAATELQPGRTDAIARALVRIKGMSSADKQQILQRRTGR